MCGGCHQVLRYRPEARVYDRLENVPLCESCAFQALVKPVRVDWGAYVSAFKAAVEAVIEENQEAEASLLAKLAELADLEAELESEVKRVLALRGLAES